MIRLNIITRCSRIQNLNSVKKSIFTTDKFSITWYVMFDTTILKDIDSKILNEIQESGGKSYFINSIPGDTGHQMINKAISEIQDGFVYVLDDDNIIHEDFYESLYESITNNPEKEGFVFHQRVDGKDFTGLEIRTVNSDSVKVTKIDMAQFVATRSIIGDIRIVPMKYIGDGIFIEEVYNLNPEKFIFIDKVLCYYNYLSVKRGASVPKVLYIGEDKPDLKSIKKGWWESDSLDVLYKSDDVDIEYDLKNFNPDIILTNGLFNGLITSNNDVKKRWVNLHHINSLSGEIAYNSAMNYILKNDTSKLVSFFTPIYNTGEKLLRTYESISKQTYRNWEWVLVNDSTDGGKTLKIAEDISSKDHRVVVYDFREKSKGIIGESKYRAAMMCRGEIMAEIDHDDYILDHSAQTLIDAFEAYPESGFVYTDCVEINENWDSMTYGDGFCFGYGKYRKEMTMGKMMDVICTPNINPKTIRHIVGIPNHIRAWRRSTYLKVGGHNRRLSIADDYELVVRTFLETKFVKVVKNCYLQFIYNSETASNTHELSRADIQRRVRSIGEFYNERINKRFKELGVEDWAYNDNPGNPLLSGSRFDENESPCNYTYIPRI